MEQENLEQAITVLESQRSVVGHRVVDLAVAALRKELAVFNAPGLIYQKEITVIYAVISGLTNMAKNMAKKDAHQLLKSIIQRLDHAITLHNGKLEAHMGNAIIALFGVHTHRENEPAWAVRAALAMQSELRAFVKECEALEDSFSELPQLELTIGLNTGPVFLSRLEASAAYTALGNAITIPFGLAQFVPPGTIFITTPTYQRIRSMFHVQPLEPVKVNQNQQPVQLYTIQGDKPRSIRVISRGIEGVETRMIGRDAQLAQLKQAFYGAMTQRQLHGVTIIGQPGMGKSRLLFEFNQWLEGLPINMVFFQGRASPPTGRLPFWVIRDVFSFYFNVQASDSADVACKKIIDGIVNATELATVEMATYISYLIGFSSSQHPLLKQINDQPEQLYHRALDYLLQFFTAMAADGYPVVIAFEDIHWADEGSLEIINRLAQHSRDVPLLIVGAAQPILDERHPTWGKNWANYTRLDLPALANEDNLQLVKEILRHVQNVPLDLQKLLIEQSQGNPLYLEELIKYLINRSVIVATGEQWKINPKQLAQIVTPMTPAEILRASINQLPQLEQKILQQASTIGRAFWDLALVQLYEKDSADIGLGVINVILDNLQEKGMILKREISPFEGTEEYIFKHEFLREVAAQNILSKAKLQYHARIAAWLTCQNGEQVDAYAALIAEHYRQAQMHLEAALWYTRAAERANAVFALSIAEHDYRLAVTLWNMVQPTLPEHKLRQKSAQNGAAAVQNRLAQINQHI